MLQKLRGLLSKEVFHQITGFFDIFAASNIDLVILWSSKCALCILDLLKLKYDQLYNMRCAKIIFIFYKKCDER